jgi:hypothetical protein
VELSQKGSLDFFEPLDNPLLILFGQHKNHYNNTKGRLALHNRNHHNRGCPSFRAVRKARPERSRKLGTTNPDLAIFSTLVIPSRRDSGGEESVVGRGTFCRRGQNSKASLPRYSPIFMFDDVVPLSTRDSSCWNRELSRSGSKIGSVLSVAITGECSA